MASLPEGRIGVNIVSGTCKVNRVLHKEAFNAGWRVGDDIVEVNGKPVATNQAIKVAVKTAINTHVRLGTPVRFTVRRWSPKNSARSMVHMTSGKGVDHLVPMLDLTLGLLQDYSVVLFMDGPLGKPGSRPSARVVKALDGLGAIFKAIDCSDEKVNPGMQSVVKELTGEDTLPQLFIGGKHIGGGRTVLRLHRSGKLGALLDLAGAVPSLQLVAA